MEKLQDMSDFTDLNSQFRSFKKIHDSRKGDKAVEIIDNWDKISGNFFGKKAIPDRVINSELFVKVINAAWIQQGNFFKEDLIKNCNDFIGTEFIKNIKFFVGDGKLSEPEKKADEFKPIEKKFYSLYENISEKDKKLIEDKTSVIEDEEVRTALRRMLGKSRVLENSLVNQGWKKCSICSALHNNKTDFCFSCTQNPNKPKTKVIEHKIEKKE